MGLFKDSSAIIFTAKHGTGVIDINVRTCRAGQLFINFVRFYVLYTIASDRRATPPNNTDSRGKLDDKVIAARAQEIENIQSVTECGPHYIKAVCLSPSPKMQLPIGKLFGGLVLHQREIKRIVIEQMRFKCKCIS